MYSLQCPLQQTSVSKEKEGLHTGWQEEDIVRWQERRVKKRGKDSNNENWQEGEKEETKKTQQDVWWRRGKWKESTSLSRSRRSNNKRKPKEKKWCLLPIPWVRPKRLRFLSSSRDVSNHSIISLLSFPQSLISISSREMNGGHSCPSSSSFFH